MQIVECVKCGAINSIPDTYKNFNCIGCEHPLRQEPEKPNIAYKEDSNGKNGRPETVNKGKRKRPLLPVRHRR